MFKIKYLLVIASLGIVFSCSEENIEHKKEPTNELSEKNDVLDRILNAGFKKEDIVELKDHYIVEGDLIFYKKEPASINSMKSNNQRTEQTRSNFIVSDQYRSNITVYLNTSTFSSIDLNSNVDDVIYEFNNLNAGIKFSRVYSPSQANIEITQGGLGLYVCGQAGFPLSDGRPFDRVYISEETLTDLNLTSSSQLTFLVAHELGHCIGLRHTNWRFQGESGSILIDGTPNKDDNSIMNGSTCGNYWYDFSPIDKVAISTLYPLHYSPVSLNLYAIAKNATGTHSTEIHILNAQDTYNSFLFQTGTILTETGDSFDFLVEDYNYDGAKDLIAISKASTGTRSTEIHILNGADNFRSFLLQTGTALQETDGNFKFALSDYNLDGRLDLYIIKKLQTGSGTTEVHVLDGSNNFQSYLLHTGTSFGMTNANWDFFIKDVNRDGYGDLVGILKAESGSGTTEVHVLNGSNNFQSSIIHTGTVLWQDSSFEFDAGDVNRDGYVDIFAFKKSGTASQRTEVHILNGQTNYQSFILQKATGLVQVGSNFKLLAK